MQIIDTNINFRENPSGRFQAASYGQKDRRRIATKLIVLLTSALRKLLKRIL